MCRTRQEIIENEPEVQRLISLKKKIEHGDINGFNASRQYFELQKLESQIESTIREFMISDKLDDVEEKVDKLETSQEKHFGDHAEFHKKYPSIIELFRRSPMGMLSLFFSFFVGSSLFYIKETRDVLLSFVGMSFLTGEGLLIIVFPLFLFLFITGIVSIINSYPVLPVLEIDEDDNEE